MQQLERTILRQLFSNKEYAERVVPYLREDYFYTTEAGIIYRLYLAFYEKYHKIPQFAAIRIGLDSVPNLNERVAASCQAALKEVEAEDPLNGEQDAWLLETTEEFCQDRAVYCAMQQAIRVMDDPKATRHVIPDLMKDALAVSFDTHIGHDFIEDADARWDFYHRPETKIPFDLDVLNAQTKGGVTKKTLNVVMAGTNVGKSLFLTHTAAAYWAMGKNVLYFTMEMSEERIAERIDANRMNIPLDDLESVSRADFIRKIHFLKSASTGRLKIKEFPTGAAHAGHFRAFIQELRLKQNFVPDVIFVDYLTICTSARIKMGAGVNSYTLYKFVAEELRGLAVECDCPLWTAAQFNREGFDNSDPSLKNIGESWAIPQTADFMFALVQTEDLEKLGQIAFQPMKNRYQRKKTYQQELLGIDTSRMKLYDLSGAQLAASVSAPPPGVQKPTGGAGAFSRPLGAGRRRPFTSLKKDAQEDESI